MQITPYVDALQRDLAAVAAAAAPETAAAAERISAALEPSVRLRLLDAVTEAAHELSPQVPSGRVEVRLAAGDPSLVYVGEEPEAAPPATDDALSARITLRLPESLKAAVEAAAAREGVSVNTWLVHAIGRSVERRPSQPPGKRLWGFAQS